MNKNMEWIDENSTEEQVLTQLRQLGIIKRNSKDELRPVLPLKRPLTFQETKVIRELFGEHKYSDIDANGHIIFGDPKLQDIVGNVYITDEDLKAEIQRRKG